VFDLINYRTNLLLETIQGNAPVILGEQSGVGNSETTQVIYNIGNYAQGSSNFRYDGSNLYLGAATGPSGFTGPTGPNGQAVFVGAPFMPNADSTVNIGATGLNWHNVYTKNIQFGAGSLTVSQTNNVLTSQVGPTGPVHAIGPVMTENFMVAGGDTQAGNYDTIAYTYDGTVWTSAKATVFGDTSDSDVYAVAYNGSQWLAVGVADTTIPVVAYSPDGIAWTEALSAAPFFGTGGRPSSVAWTGSLWIVGGRTQDPAEGPILITSPDGVTWTSAFSAGSAGGIFRSVATNGTFCIAVGYDAAGAILYTSPDGITWTSQSTTWKKMYCVAWNGSVWVIGGNDASSNGNFQYSYDGTTWTAASWSGTNPYLSVAGDNEGPQNIAWNGSSWASAGAIPPAPSDGIVTTSVDGITWSYSGTPVFDGGVAFGIGWNGTYWVVIGSPAVQPSASVAYSRDAITWAYADSANPMFGGNFGYTVASRRPLPYLPAPVGLKGVAVVSSSPIAMSAANDGQTLVVKTITTLNLTFTTAPPPGWHITMKNKTGVSLTIKVGGTGTTTLAANEVGFVWFNGTNYLLDDTVIA
jgi:hypothetical protein